MKGHAKKPALPCIRCGRPFVGSDEDRGRCSNCFNPHPVLHELPEDEDSYPETREDE